MDPTPHNPYSAEPLAAGPPNSESSEAAVPRDMGMVRHVPTVATLMLVQGVLESLMGMFFIGMGVFMAVAVREAMIQQPPNGQDVEKFAWMMGGIYGGLGLVGIIGGVVKIVAGILNLRFKSRIFGIVALCSGATTFLNWLCLPTAIGLGIYGLIVYFDEAVRYAFQLGRQGHHAADIRTGFWLRDEL